MAGKIGRPRRPERNGKTGLSGRAKEHKLRLDSKLVGRRLQRPQYFLDLFRSDNGNNRTGWNNPHYDQLMAQADEEVDPHKRAEILCDAETILVRDEAPIIPIYFYLGFNYYNPAKIGGVYPNILDDHPFNAIYKIKSAMEAAMKP